MKFYYISDLHLQVNDFNELLPLFDKEDMNDSYLILAGDVSDLVDVGCPIAYYIEFFRKVCRRFKQVFYVYGNHEFWNSSPSDIKEAETLFDSISNLTYCKLNEPVKLITVEDKTILMFSDWFDLKPDWILRPRTNDPKYIRNFETFSHNYRNSIDTALNKTPNQKVDLVITHYLPHEESIPIRYRGGTHNDVNNYFNTNRFYLVEQRFNPDVWVHGHTHDKVNTQINNCKVLCNPYGTPYDKQQGTTLNHITL